MNFNLKQVIYLLLMLVPHPLLHHAMVSALKVYLYTFILPIYHILFYNITDVVAITYIDTTLISDFYTASSNWYSCTFITMIAN